MSEAIRGALEILARSETLDRQATKNAVLDVMSGETSETLISAFLTALRLRGETSEHLNGAVDAVLSKAGAAPPVKTAETLDTCGTGGDGASTVNVSTASAIVTAAAGAPVAKHGNRSASGNSGSAEVLTELGVNIDADPAVVARCLDELGVTFLFAPRYHPALRFAAPIRKQLPFRTLFNLVGPLANPIRPTYQLVGVPGEAQARLIAESLAASGIRRAAVVRGDDGLDEVTLGGLTFVTLVEAGTLRETRWLPEDFGLKRVRPEELRVSGPPESASIIREVLDGKDSPSRAMILANSAAALFVSGRSKTLAEGARQAAEAIDTGAARRLLDSWIQLSREGQISSKTS